MKKITFYVDMDGVLARWNEMASEEETHERGYFLSREVELSAVAMTIMLYQSGADVKVLSSVYQDDHSTMEKREWLNLAGLADIPAVFVPYGEDKHAYVEVDEDTVSVLIDDYSKNLNAWEAEGLLAIKFMNGINDRPKLLIQPDNTVQMKLDSWAGYSIDYRMTPKQMYTVVTSIAAAEAA